MEKAAGNGVEAWRLSVQEYDPDEPQNEVDEMKCQICGETEEVVNDMCWWCEADANDPDPYVDDSLNEVSMGRFDDDPPEW